jgi:hypothetical protein
MSLGRAVFVLTAWVLTSCAGAPRHEAERPPPAPLSYRIELPDSLRAVHVSVCSDGPLPSQLVPIHREGRSRFVRAELEARGAARVPLAGPVLSIPREAGQGGGCVHYDVQLVSGGGDPDAPMGFTNAVYAPTSSWLWAPEPRDPRARYRAEVILPEGMRASALFPRDPETGSLSFGESAFDFITYAAFGELELLPVAVPGGCVEIAAVPGGPPPEALLHWITSASDAASRALGRLPAESVSVIALPIGEGASRGDPLAFGMAAHGERASLLAFMWSDATREALGRDWVAVHELSHLGHAFLGGASAWLTEGLATYYETILRARAGWVSGDTALLQLERGFRRGEAGGTGRTLRDESEDRHRTGAYDRVYWAGAAIALMIDVALRAEGSSLDAALERAYPLREATLSDRELLLAMDGGTPGTATRVAEAWMETSVFPDLGPTYAALGVTFSPSGLSTSAEDQALREALLNQSPPLASNPPDCSF